MTGGRIMCQHWPDAPGCDGEADLEYTMNFDDIEEPPIYWCGNCGPGMHAMDKTLQKAFDQNPELVKKFADAIDKVEGTKH